MTNFNRAFNMCAGVMSIVCALQVNEAGAADYSGPVSRVTGGSPAVIAQPFGNTGATVVEPAGAAGVRVRMANPFPSIGSLLKATDYGSGANESVFLRTSVTADGREVMSSINIQDTRFDVPVNQVKSLTILNLNGASLVTMVQGQTPGGSPALQLLDAGIAGYAASSLVGRRPVSVSTGSAFVYNRLTNSFEPVGGIVTGITLD